MKYMLLIYGDEQRWQGLPDDERDAFIGEYFAYTEELTKAGAMVAGAPLQPTTAATTVRIRDGETLTTDGPFAETKEQLGGYYLIDVETLDEAIEAASQVPGGTIEIRPLEQRA